MLAASKFRLVLTVLVRGNFCGLIKLQHGGTTEIMKFSNIIEPPVFLCHTEINAWDLSAIWI